MSVVINNPNYRSKFDAFRIIAESKHEPLKEAIACALQLRAAASSIEKALEDDIKPETRAQLTLALVRAKPDEFHAWIKIAEFVYAKPKQALELTGSLTLEQVLAASMDKPIDMLPDGQKMGI